MNKKFLDSINVDMDGTIAALYNYPNWLELIEAQSIEPFLHCKPLIDLTFMANILNEMRENYGVKINIVTWMPKKRKIWSRDEREYKEKVIEAKRCWLAEHEFPYDNFIAVKYGKPKHDYVSCPVNGRAVLIDDNAMICREWNIGRTINARKVNVNRELFKMLDWMRKNY